MSQQGQNAAPVAAPGAAAALAAALDVNAASFYDDLRQLQQAVLAARRPAGLAFSLYDREASATALRGYLDGGLQAMPPALAAFEAMNVAELARTIDNGALAADAADRWMARGQPSPHSDDGKRAALVHLQARGVVHGVDTSKVLGKWDALVEQMREPVSQDPDIKPLHDQFDAWNKASAAEFGQLKAMRKQFFDALYAGRPDGMGGLEWHAEKARLQEGLNDYSQKVADFYTAYSAEFEARKAAIMAVQKERQGQRNAQTEAAFREDGEAVLSAILAASPVSAEDATAWAERQEVDPATLKKLKKLGYDRDALYRDMAEFYRLTGGKCSAIRLSSDGGRRANASGINARLGEKVINVGTRFNKTVLFHELAHHLENDAIAKGAANGFLLARREDSKTYRLRDLTGSTGYGMDELAYRDSWMDEYIGKVYRDGVTEVFSMGVQYLATPKDAALFAAKDPDMFALITGYLSSPLTPAMAAKLDMHGGHIAQQQEVKQAQEEQFASALETLAGNVSLARDNWWQEQIDNGGHAADALRAYEFVKGKEPEYLGSVDNFRVFAGVFRSRTTGRNAKGHLVVELHDMEGYAIPRATAVHGGMASAKALIAITMQQRDSGVSTHIASIWNNYFSPRLNRDDMVSRLILAAQAAPQESAA